MSFATSGSLWCFKVGLFWRGITHDLSKLRPSEFFPYANFFSGDPKSKRDKTGYYKPTDTGHDGFDWAWFRHQKRNDHHWQWWVTPDESGGVARPMSSAAREEMLCDWKGAGRAQGMPDTEAWFWANRQKMLLHIDTKFWIDQQLEVKK